jgi:hypothetical protein
MAARISNSFFRKFFAEISYSTFFALRILAFACISSMKDEPVVSKGHNVCRDVFDQFLFYGIRR